MELGNTSPHAHAPPTPTTTQAVGFSQQGMCHHALLLCNWNTLRQINSEAPRAFGVLFAVGSWGVLQTAMFQDKQEGVVFSHSSMECVESLGFTVTAD